MTDKFHMSRVTVKYILSKYRYQYVCNAAQLEGVSVSYVGVETIIEGGLISELNSMEIQLIRNLNYGWDFMWNTLDYPVTLQLISAMHGVIAHALVPTPGVFRTHPVKISGTSWQPQIPDYAKICTDVERIMAIPCNTERALKLFLYLARAQLYSDCNKRIALMMANHELARTGAGVLELSVEHKEPFYKLLVEYYESANDDKILEYMYTNLIYGIEDFAETAKPVPGMSEFLAKLKADTGESYEQLTELFGEK